VVLKIACENLKKKHCSISFVASTNEQDMQSPACEPRGTPTSKQNTQCPAPVLCVAHLMGLIFVKPFYFRPLILVLKMCDEIP